MTEQLEQFKNLIDMAKESGQEGAVSILREICQEAAAKAPNDDLIKMAEFLYELRMSAGESK